MGVRVRCEYRFGREKEGEGVRREERFGGEREIRGRVVAARECGWEN